jgi:hypothetical protein
MKKLLKSLAIGTLALPFALALNGGKAEAVTGTTALTVNVPNFIILYYPSALTLNFANMTVDPAVGDSGTFSFGVATDNTVTKTGADLTTSNTYSRTFTIPDIWAVRGITPSGTMDISIASTSSTLTNTTAGGGSISVGSLEVTPFGGSTGASLTGVTMTGMAPKFGSVGMTLNMTSATKSGTFNGGSYTITVTGT